VGPFNKKKGMYSSSRNCSVHTPQCKYQSNPFTKRIKYSMFTFNDLPATNPKVMTVSKILVYKKSTFFLN
jgi:hypothetical protein